MDFWTQITPLDKISSPTVGTDDSGDAASILQKGVPSEEQGVWDFRLYAN